MLVDYVAKGTSDGVLIQPHSKTPVWPAIWLMTVLNLLYNNESSPRSSLEWRTLRLCVAWRTTQTKFCKSAIRIVTVLDLLYNNERLVE